VSTSEAIGTVTVQLGDEVLAQQPLFSLAPVQSGNFMRRAIDEIRLWFE
jgi:hypothetical protein